LYYFKATQLKLKNKYSAISLTEMRDYEKNLTKMIQTGEIETALDLSESLLQRCNSSTLLTNIILLKSNHSQYKSSFNMNLIDYNEYSRNQAKTSKALLDLKDDIKSIIKVIN
jgi:ribosomal protein S20